MPELPEVETVKNGLAKAWVGKTIEKIILRRENLRYPFPENFSKQLEGYKINGIRRIQMVHECYQFESCVPFFPSRR